MVLRLIACVSGCLLVTGCGVGAPEQLQRGKVGCEEAVGQGVSIGKANARLIAEAAAIYQTEDLKGFMLRDGYRALTVGRRRIDCQSFELGGGLTQCVAKAQICGR